MTILKNVGFIAALACLLLIGFAIGRATSANQKQVQAAEARAAKAESAALERAAEVATMTKQATYWEATAKARSEEIDGLRADLAACMARPTTNNGKLKFTQK